MLQYYDALDKEFDGDLRQIAAANVIDSRSGQAGDFIDTIDQSFWDAIRVGKAGHKLMLALGIAKLISK